MARSSYEKTVWSAEEGNAAGQSARPEPNMTSRIIRRFRELATRDIWAKTDPGHYVDWTNDRTWEKIRNEGCYHRSDELLISCGTVTVYQAESPRPEVLVIYNSNIGIYQLPKGRKNFDENYLDAALRETTEETGVPIRPLRLRFGSRSTPPKVAHGAAKEVKDKVEDKDTGITESLSNEIIGISEYPDPATGAWRNIHWFAAKPKGCIQRDDSRMPEKEDREKFSTFWFSEKEALARLKLDDEKFMVRVTFAYIRSMSPDDWESNRELERLEDQRDSSRPEIKEEHNGQADGIPAPTAHTVET
ncbi:hypothetical protein F4809DRAFT_627199 [Biscogniauxia mediterranea]|nr:hypothetical protein F4809DRAFT_627199 [Biscogniauxia mediterranea]